MDQEKIRALLNRQKEINLEIQVLNNESTAINEILESYTSIKSTDNKRPSKSELLESLGFTVSSKSIDGTQMHVINNGTAHHTVLFKKSKFYSETNYNAWYTFNPGIEKLVDFVILEYLTTNRKVVYSILPKKIFSQIAVLADKFPDGRFNLYIQGDDQKATSRNLNLDLTETINNFEVLE